MALNEVIASLKISDSSGLRGKYSNTGTPKVFSTAGWPVITEWIASA